MMEVPKLENPLPYIDVAQKTTDAMEVDFGSLKDCQVACIRDTTDSPHRLKLFESIR
jgi:hypothetical protein